SLYFSDTLTATTLLYPLSLHDALPILRLPFLLFRRFHICKTGRSSFSNLFIIDFQWFVNDIQTAFNDTRLYFFFSVQYRYKLWINFDFRFIFTPVDCLNKPISTSGKFRTG